MDRKEIANKYIEFLENGEVEKVISLFSDKGMVQSPLYGIKKASDFYNELANDTSNSELSVKGVFQEENSNQLALYFTYKWTLKNNEKVIFDVVDIIEFDTQNKIDKLTIIYDTVIARQLINQLNS